MQGRGRAGNQSPAQHSMPHTWFAAHLVHRSSHHAHDCYFPAAVPAPPLLTGLGAASAYSTQSSTSSCTFFSIALMSASLASPLATMNLANWGMGSRACRGGAGEGRGGKGGEREGWSRAKMRSPGTGWDSGGEQLLLLLLA